MICGTLTAALCCSFPAQAEIDDVSMTGFAVRQSVDIAASPDEVYRTLAAPSRWWSSDHTYSHDAANLSLDPRAGGCWCETLPGGGSVQHMVVVNAMPGKMLRLRGALGPLQALAVDGTMTFALHPTGKGTELTMSYAIGGYSKAGFSDLAKAVDGVLADQMMRLRLLAETGSPVAVSQPQTKE
jgi:uncharacterized protein YndB with AHSA1/START domain